MHHVHVPGARRWFPAAAGFASALALILGAASSASAVIPPEIPLVQRLGTGARAMGMGGAYVAVGEDYTSLAYNPAGLALVKRVEFGGSLDSRSMTQDVTYFSHLESTPLDKSNINSLGFAYPFPTYRGSFVIGFSYDRAIPLDSDYFRMAPAGAPVFEQEEITEDGSVGAYRAGVAGSLSENLTVGATGVILAGNSTRERTFLYQDLSQPGNEEQDLTRTDIDYSAVTGSLGALLSLGRQARFGLVLHLPENFTLKGSGTDDVYRYQVNPPDTLDSGGAVDFDFEDHIDLPFRVAAGLALTPAGRLQNLLISADVTYADWKQIDYDGPIRTDNRGYAYRPTTDIRVGAEYAFPTFPLRLRAGFISQPLAYKLVAVDVYNGIAVNARQDQGRRYGTVGAGILLEQSLTIDAAYVFGSYQRSGHSAAGVETVEKFKDRHLILGAAFRL
jgi:long-subunit fatty acid transport protein